MWQNNVVNNNPIEYTMSVEKLPIYEFIKSFQYIPKYNIRATCINNIPRYMVPSICHAETMVRE